MELMLELPPTWLFVALAAVFGAMWGSFANVVIVRWPQGMSVVKPASHCFTCNSKIPFYDNIPVLSYLMLRGRCRSCKARFSPRYALVELCMALLSVGILKVTLLADPVTPAAGLGAYFVWFAFVWALLTAGAIDLETYLLPDAITLPGIAVGLLAHLFVIDPAGSSALLGVTGNLEVDRWLDLVLDPLIGAVGGYLLLSLVFVHGYKLLTGQQGMGEGDPKLIAMLGAFIGVRGALFALCFGALQGLVIGTALIIHRRRTGCKPEPPIPDEELDVQGKEVAPDSRFRKARVPFGPFLALGALEYLFFGDWIIDLYLSGITDLMVRVMNP